MNGYLSFTHYDLLNPPRWVGLANYRYLFGTDAQIWPAVRNTLVVHRVVVPLQVLFAFGMAVMLTRAQARRRRLPHGLLPARARAAGRGHARVRLPAQPGHRAGQHDPRARSGSTGPLWFNDPALVEAVARAARALGHRQHDDHLPRRRARRARSTSTSRPSSTAPARLRRLRWVTLPTISPVILFAVVLGVIQGLQYFTQAYVAASVAGGRPRRRARRATSSSATPRARRSSIPSSSTTTASASSTWATPPRWRCCCSGSRSRSRS